MKLRSLRRAGAALLALALLCSLLTLPVSAEEAAEIKPSRIELSSTRLNLDLNAAGYVQLDYTIVPASTTNKAVTWSSSDASVATVDSSGVVRPVARGDATITVTSDADSTVKATCLVTVTQDIPVESISLRYTSGSMKVGEEANLPTVDVYPSNTTDRITWTSDKPDCVAVSDGKLVAKSAGTAVITVSSMQNPNIYDRYTVTVEAAAAITKLEVTPPYLNLTKGESAALTVTVEGSSASQGVKWYLGGTANKGTSNNIATVSSTGVVTIRSDAKAGSQVSVFAEANADPGWYDFCVVTVIEPPTPKVNAVTITSPSTDAYRYVDPGRSITLTAIANPPEATEADRAIRWSSDKTNIASVIQTTGVVTGVAPGEATITASAAGDSTKTDSRLIETSGLLLSYVRRSTTGGTGTTVNLNADSVVPLYQYRDISVTTMVYGNARNKSITWSSSNNSVAQAVAGRVTANYPGEATITASVDGTGFSASFKVAVSEDVADAISVDMGSRSTYSFSSLLGQLNNRSQTKAGAPLDSIYNLKVSTKNGSLYYKYASPSSPGHGVGGSERFYYQASAQGQMALRDVTFVPTVGFSGTAIVDYNAESTSGTTFTGTIRIEVSASASSGGISYTTEANLPVRLASGDFTAICKNQTGQAVRYVTFSQPSASQGTLYHNYTPGGQYAAKAASNIRYYVSSKPSIDELTFVPANGFSGTVTIPYTCVDSTGTSFTGNVIITVTGTGSSGSASRNVEYYINLNQHLYLSGSDFNNACQYSTGYNLNYIRFTSLPSSGTGTLYTNYAGSSSTRVTSGRNYYRNSSPWISDITFVPAQNYSGTITVPFTGASTNGQTFSGSLIIHVDSGSGTAGSRTISYTVPVNSSIRLNGSDFNSACRSVTGDTLDYVRFNRISTAYGALYEQYNTSSRSGTYANTGVNYYYSGGTRPISNMTFAATSTPGTTTFGFTGYSTRGNSFSGTLQVRVTGSGASTNTNTGTGISSGSASAVYYAGCSAPIAFRSSDFQAVTQTALGTTLSSVQFNTLPGAGHLYQNYTGPSQIGSSVASGTRYTADQLNQITYLPRAEYQGTISIPYTAYDTQGGSHSSTVEIQLSNTYCDSSFTDTASGLDWAKPSIEFLRQSGITSGYRDGTFRPRQSISRGEFTLMICRAFQFSTSGSSGFPDVPESSSYAGAVASARELGIVQGENGLFHPDRPISRQSAMTMICRALDAAGQSLPTADTSLLSSYNDAGQVSAFARSSVASLIQIGAVRGNSAMQLNPTAPISRAEMAVILHRVLAR